MVQISQVSAYLFIYYFIFYYFILILHNSSTHTLCTNSKLFISLLNLHSILFFFYKIRCLFLLADPYIAHISLLEKQSHWKGEAHEKGERNAEQNCE